MTPAAIHAQINPFSVMPNSKDILPDISSCLLGLFEPTSAHNRRWNLLVIENA